MGCLKLTYRQETDFRVIYSKKELTLKNSSQKAYSSYFYGFNGMEKDNEVSGNGNSYTAEFWQYSPRIGRRWNIDPVVKSWQSNYSCFSDSPIWRIDPKGDDDYFDSQGNYLFTNGTSNNIQVMNSDNVFTLIGNITYTSTNAKVLANIGRYYAQQIGLSVTSLRNGSFSVGQFAVVHDKYYGGYTKKSVSLYNKGNASSNDIMNYNEDDNTISFSVGTDGKISHFLNDISNLKSTIKHEKLHQLLKSNDGFEHLEVYLQQVKSPEFKNTTDEYKENLKSNVNELINKALNYTNEKFDTNYTEDQITAIKKQAKIYAKKFEEAEKSSK